ncbi:MAG: hypothetical protein ACAH95_05855 [Fimbriimonas sp.]
MRRLVSQLSICAIGVAALSASTPAQMLGERSESMGGAGLAYGLNYRLNPAHLSLMGGGYRLPVPLLEYRASGKDIGQVTSYLMMLRRSGFDSNRLNAMAHGGQLARVDDFGGSIGLVYGSASFTYLARGYQELLPSSQGLDVYGVAFEAYQFSFGQELPVKGGRFAVGTSARMIHASYDHQAMSASGIQRGIDAGPSSQSGFGLDLGMTFKPETRRDTTYALVIRNLINPGIAFDRQMPDGSVQRKGVEPFRMTVNTGFATQLGDATWLAVDGLDLGNSIGRRQVAMGIDQQLNRYLGLQIGYNTRTSFTIGLSFFGIHARLAGRSPLTVETGIRF